MGNSSHYSPTSGNQKFKEKKTYFTVKETEKTTSYAKNKQNIKEIVKIRAEINKIEFNKNKNDQ